MNKKVIITIWSILLVICFLVSACSKPVEDITKQKPIQIGLTQDIMSLDPVETNDIFSEAVLRCIYTSLYDFDDDLSLKPKLVKQAGLIDDYTWRIKIHDNVMFQNGTRLTADDVVFSIKRAMQGSRTKKLLEPVADVEKIDDTTFLIHTKNPHANLPPLFAKAETSILSKAVVETPGYNFSTPVGAGPFKLVSWEKNNKIKLERFDDYYLEKVRSPYLNFVVIVSEQDRTAAFLNGDVDILFSLSSYDCEKLRLSNHVKILKSPSTKIEYLSLNTQHPPLDNPKVRLAISKAINRNNITKFIYHGYSTPSSSLIPNGVVGHLDLPIDYNPELAKILLKEAGYENGFEFTVITINTIRKNTLEYIKLDLAAVGIKLNYNLVTMQEAVDLMMAGKHDSILVGWAYNADPTNVLSVLLGTGSGKTMNSSNYSNPIVDELIKKGQSEINPANRKKIYQTINQIVTNDSPIVVLQNPMVLSATLTNIEGIHFNSQGLIKYEALYRK